MATTQVLDLLLQDGADYESTVGVLGLLYASVAVHAGAAYRRTPPAKLRARRLTGSLFAASALRSLGFLAFALVTHTARSRLLAKAVVLLFDVPDFIVVSSYALLIVVWFEAFLDARRHWLDRRTYRWHWRAAYFGLNVGLVSAMVLLYALILFGGPRLDGVRYTYVLLAAVSLAAPLAHACLYVTLSLRFAAFPLRGGDGDERAHRSRVVVAWACGRALWGAAVAVACAPARRLPAWARDDPQRGGVALAALFLFAEVCPFVLALDSGFLRLVDADAAAAGPPAAYGTAPAAPRVESSESFV